jgi:hypothetical protein
MTRDIDVVVDPTEEAIRLMVDLVDRDRFYMGDAEDAFQHRSMFNLIEPDTGWKVDFVVRKDRPFSEVEFQRRFPTQVAGVQVFMATAEDTMLAKLEWGAASGSDRQMDDVVAIALGQELDIEYLLEWAHELGVEEALESALAAAGKATNGPTSRRRWEAPAEKLEVYQDAETRWRFAIWYEVDVADGRLSASTLEEAQAELLTKVERLTNVRYSVAWTCDTAGLWSGTLTVS